MTLSAAIQFWQLPKDGSETRNRDVTRSSPDCGCRSAAPSCCPCFLVNEDTAAAIRTIYEREGDLSAAIELRRLFPGHHRQRQGTRLRQDYL